VDNGKLDLIIQTNKVIKREKVTPPLLAGENNGQTTLMFQDTQLPANPDEKQIRIDIITLTV